MTRYVLSRNEYKLFLDHLIFSKKIDNELCYLFDDSLAYSKEIIGLNYFLSKIVEVYLKKEIDCQFIIESVYSFQEKMFFSIDEMNEDFIDNLFKNSYPNEKIRILKEIEKTNIPERKAELLDELSCSLENDLINFVNSKYYGR